MAPEKTQRIFTAIELPAESRRKIFLAADELSGEIISFKTAGEADMHLTLKFLARVSPGSVEEVKKTLSSCAADARPFCVELSGAGAFPSPGNPRIIWAGAEDAGGLSALQSAIEESLALLGYERERRPFHPHITAGRIKKPPGSAEIKKIKRWLERNRHTPFGTFEVRGFSLFRSILSPAGASYSRLAVFDIKESV